MRGKRQARRAQVRRRRVAAAAVAGVIVAGAVAGVLTAFGGTGRAHVAAAARHVERMPATHSRGPSKETAAVKRFVKLGLPLWCGGHKGRYVALTFDDGPGPYTTRYAFKIFKQFEVRVTWFLVGRLLSSYPGVARRELAYGPLGDHTWTHAYLPGLSFGQIAQEIASAQNAIEKASRRPVMLFRPPYGARDARIDAESKSLGMLQVLWSIDSLDSQGADWNGITREVLNNVRTGSIILFHENRGQTIRALKFNILPALRKRGFKTVTIPQMLVLNPPSLKQLKAGPAGC
jgi:peptidoglycan/xylan/chitin deacetylase (PgdA/CDA1 family)